MNNKILLVDTAPYSGRGSKTINFGMNLVKRTLKADICKWKDVVDIRPYDTIAFNVFYAMNILNIYPFLKRNKININGKTHEVIVGGQGINRNGIVDSLVDRVFCGELDYENNKREIVSPFVIGENHAIIEIQRGCKYKCKFCQYGNLTGGIYREKGIDLVESQLKEIKSNGIRQVNFLSVNLGGYSKIDRLIEICQSLGIRIRSADTTIKDFHKLKDYMKYLPKSWRFGIETFDQKTRYKINKKFSDEDMMKTFQFLIKNINMLHIYLIYGIPDDNYSSWINWTKRIGELIKTNTKKDDAGNIVSNKLRIDFSVSTFEPELGTPFENEKFVDFKERKLFLQELVKEMRDAKIINNKLDLDINKFMGKFGRGEFSYSILMGLKRGDSELGEKIIKSFHNGYNGQLQKKNVEVL